MGEIRQSRFSSNQYWTNILWQNNNQVIGPDPVRAFAITVNADPVGPYSIQDNKLVWITFTAPEDYSDGYDFVFFGTGLDTLPIDLTDFNLYQSDATTPIDISSGQTLTGTDFMFPSYWGVFTGDNFTFINGNTYYMSILAPITSQVYLWLVED